MCTVQSRSIHMLEQSAESGTLQGYLHSSITRKYPQCVVSHTDTLQAYFRLEIA